MAKITLPSVASGFTVSTINSNFQAIATELNNKVLYRNNPAGNANQMANSLDMNSNRILNLPAPVGDLEPLRKIDAGNLLSRSQEAILAAAEAVEARDDAEAFATAAGISAGVASQAVIDIGSSVAEAQGYAEDAYDNSRLTVGTVTTGSPGSSVVVSINGVPGSQVINFTIPQGLAGINGTNGTNGVDGTDGREVEFQKTATHIQWRYVGAVSWTNLVALVDITGPQGPPGPSGSGTGDVIGPAVAVDSHVVVFNGTTGKIIKSSGILLSSKVSEAPSDGKLYGRKGAAWVEAPSGEVRVTSSTIVYSGGNISTITEDGVTKTFSYNGDQTINTVIWPVAGKTRTETYSYTGGVLVGMSATEV